MSFIHNSYKCECCSREINYVWQLADGKFEVYPDKSIYVFAEHHKIYSKYHVSVRYPQCKTVTCFEYSLDGKYKEKL